MRAIQIAELAGPDALRLVDLADPRPDHFASPGAGVVIDVHAAAVSFPDVLQSHGRYQFQPDLPFVPGGEVSGVVVEAAGAGDLRPGDRVAAMSLIGGMAERAVAPPHLTFRLDERMDFAAGAAFVLNYHTAYFALRMRGAVCEGERVLVHGAAGGLGTAAVQIARALGAHPVAVVSSDEKERVAREAGADQVVRSDGPWREEVQRITGGGVDVVFDPVGGDRFTDSLRALREDGRLLVVGFTGGSIPEVRVNRLLLGNTEVIGAGWGAYVMSRPEVCREIGAEIARLVQRGFVRPVVGARFPLERAADALKLIDERGATGKVVLDVA
jgi:NADPH:quinone reductase